MQQRVDDRADSHASGKPLAERTAVVTGASRGIGAEIARRLATAGARVALVARTRSALEKVAIDIGGNAVVIEADLGSPESAVRAAETVRESFAGVPDILVNNAGIFSIVELHELKIDAFSRMLETNLLAPFILLRAFLPAMRERRSGHVITIGSIADRVTYPGNGAYAATKFGMRAVHEVLREETRGSGVRATLVSPAAVDTDIWEGITFPGSEMGPNRRAMVDKSAVADAVLYALAQPPDVNVDELRLSRS